MSMKDQFDIVRRALFYAPELCQERSMEALARIEENQARLERLLEPDEKEVECRKCGFVFCEAKDKCDGEGNPR